jgi:hypothetical protein
MKKLGASLIAGLMTVTTLSGIALAQGKPQTIAVVDIAGLSTGYRGSKVIGSDVRNDANDKIGTVDDILIARTDFVPYAIISVGGFLGVGNKLVAVPYRALQPREDNKSFILPGATKDQLKSLSEFKYND